MTMTAKFNGSCKRCGGTILAGERIVWAKGAGATHFEATRCELVKARVEAARPAAAPVAVDMSAVVAFLAMARERGLKSPRVHFLLDSSRIVTLSLAGSTSRNPGAVYVKVGGDYVGLVEALGAVRGTHGVKMSEAVVAALTVIAADPAAAAKAYAALTGRCSFCGLGLTDAGSVEVGYGPICAKRYGLPHQAMGSNAVQAVA